MSEGARQGTHVADRDALVVAMTLVPGLYSRNRMFELFKVPEVKEARRRAAQLRGVVRQLASERAKAELVEFGRAVKGPAVLAYRVGVLRLSRRLELSPLEAACVAHLCGRAGVVGVRPTAEDRSLLDGALRRLSGDVAAKIAW